MLSAVVITNNAKDTIGACIDALLKVASDIVIVDSGSNDGTREICETKPVRYFQKEWEGYSANKNYGNAIAIHPYILSIDSDEILSHELIRSINTEFSGTNKLAEAYSLRFVTNFNGKWIKYGSWNPEWHIRIFDKRLIQWELMDVHEALNLQPNHHLKRLNGLVLHFSYPSVESHLKKIEKYTDLFAERNFKAGKKATIIHTLFSPIFTFFSSYVLKLGFLDGAEGWVIAKNNALYTQKKYSKLVSKWKNA